MFKYKNFELKTNKYNIKRIKQLKDRQNNIDVKLSGKSTITISQLPNYTEFYNQFLINKILKGYYRISEIKSIVDLERRLDVIVFRLGYSRSIDQARDFIKTGKVKVNNCTIKNSNYFVEIGSTIEIDNTITPSITFFRSLLPFFHLPDHLITIHFRKGILIKKPSLKNITLPPYPNLKG